jgi:flagellin-like hook-associated protein FlgL
VTVAGERASARGNFLKVVSTFFTGTIELNPYTNQDPTAAPGTPPPPVRNYTFTVKNNSGLLFHLNMGTPGLANEQRVIGLPNMVPSLLGEQPLTIGGVSSGGSLTSMVSGGDNDLFTNPANALKVIDGALSDVSSARAYLGAFVANTLEPNSRSLEVAIENLSASESSIRDLDFASAVAEMTKYQVLFQAGVSVLAQANMIPQSVLQLLK